MSKKVKVEVPDIGDFRDIDIIEVMVSAGDRIAAEDPLITLESDKATIEIPSPQAGTVKEVRVKVSDKVSQGDVILTMELAGAEAGTGESAEEKVIQSDNTATAQAETAPAAEATTSAANDRHAEVVVLGSGPGGYTAAFRAADLGKQVILIEKYDSIGGVCLNVGCIPSKTLLHSAQIITEAETMAVHGISFGKPIIDLTKLAAFKNKVIGQLTGGLAALAKKRKVDIVTGVGRFSSPTTIEVSSSGGAVTTVSFEHAIIAAGSKVLRIPGLPYEDERLMDSTGALELADIPKRLLVVGGGIIGLEMATVYDALGSSVSIVELSPGLIPGCDRDLVRPLEKRVKKRYENIWLNAKVTAIQGLKSGLKVSFEGKGVPTDTFDRVLLAVGRSPNGHDIGAENAGVDVDERGFIPVNKQQQTNVNNIYAIGDIVGQPMLAHKATHEGKTAAEVIAGMKSYFDAKTIPSVAYTDPEVAWMGVTEEQAKADGIDYKKGVFPWAASGRSLSNGRNEGVTKVLFDKDSHRIIGAGMVGPNAGELIAEAVLALEMGADIEDIALTVHPHPTLSETFNFAAEVAEGTCTDIYIPKR